MVAKRRLICEIRHSVRWILGGAERAFKLTGELRYCPRNRKIGDKIFKPQLAYNLDITLTFVISHTSAKQSWTRFDVGQQELFRKFLYLRRSTMAH